jgi:hypothetical protein
MVAAGLSGHQPSITGWLTAIGSVFFFVFLVLALFRSKTLNKNIAELKSK